MAGLMIAVLPWLKRDSYWRIPPIAVTVLLTVRYVHWRFAETIPPLEQTTNFVVGYAFLVIEFLAIAGAILSLITLSRTRNRSAEVDTNRAWLFDRETLPNVDVFICTYNEERAILERTIIGALAMDYPDYRVWVLDDGRRDWLKSLAADLGCRYLTRPDNTHAKAGNINHALDHVMILTDPPDFVSILDADFVPARSFLSRTLTLFREQDVGIVQTPQHFINPDPIQANLGAADAWPDEQRYFFDVVMPSKDAWGTAFCCGTSSVIRASALRDIGGFPTDSVTEDYLLTLRMRQSGYRTVYLNEQLSLGLAPEGLKEYVTQRSRWCLGFIQIFRSKDGPFNFSNSLRIVDRLSLLESFLYWAGAYAFRVLGFAVPILYLLFDIHAVDVDVVAGLSHFLPYYFAHIATLAWISERRILPMMAELSQLLACQEILTAVAVGLAKPRGHKFKVTLKGGDRSKTVIHWHKAMTFGAILCLTALGVLVAFLLDPNRPLQNSSAIALYWSWYNIVVLITAIAVCVERPRFRVNDRLRSAGTMTVRIGKREGQFKVLDISVSGVRFSGSPPGPVGSKATVMVGDFLLAGSIVRCRDHEFAVAIGDETSFRAAMIRHVFSGLYHSGTERVRSLVVARKILARIAK